MEVGSERWTVETLGEEGDQFLVLPPFRTARLPLRLSLDLVNRAFAVLLEFRGCVGAGRSPGRVVGMRLVMAIGAKRNPVVDMVVPGNNMMHLQSMESATYAAPATAVYQELLRFSFVETHGGLLPHLIERRSSAGAVFCAPLQEHCWVLLLHKRQAGKSR